MSKLLLATAAICILTACVPATSIVSDYNGASVTIVTPALADAAEAKIAAQTEADRICRTGGKKKAEYASTRSDPNTYENYNLFLCL